MLKNKKKQKNKKKKKHPPPPKKTPWFNILHPMMNVKKIKT
jgi:hypothetical protein